jgi:hypothetical protein
MNRLAGVVWLLSASPVVDLGRRRGAISKQDNRLTVRRGAREIGLS